jgi:hypothetical protein
MGSKPITAIAKMKSYENTVAKKLGDPTDPPKSVEEDVRDENSNDLLRGSASFSFGPDKVTIDRQEKTRNLRDSDVWNTNRNNVQQKYADFKSYQTAAETYRNEQGDSFTPAQIGTGEFTEIVNRQPGDLLAKYAYKPQVREADTFTIRQSRRQDRDVRATKRRLDRAIKKGSQAEITALQAKYDRKLKEQTEGVNPYNTRRSKENIKAPEGTQTKSEFESRFGGNNMGIQEIKSFTPGDITFSTPTMPSSNRTASDFTGSGSYLNRGARVTNEQQLQNFFNLHDSAVSGNEGNLWNLKGMPKKGNVNRGYKMGGYGTKNK